MNDATELGRIAVAFASTFGEGKTWEQLAEARAEVLRGALNDGISEDEVVLHEARLGDFEYTSARFRDEESDFTAEYLMLFDRLVFSHED